MDISTTPIFRAAFDVLYHCISSNTPIIQTYLMCPLVFECSRFYYQCNNNIITVIVYTCIRLPQYCINSSINLEHWWANGVYNMVYTRLGIPSFGVSKRKMCELSELIKGLNVREYVTPYKGQCLADICVVIKVYPMKHNDSHTGDTGMFKRHLIRLQGPIIYNSVCTTYKSEIQSKTKAPKGSKTHMVYTAFINNYYA